MSFELERRLDVLDGWRGVSIALVVVYHLAYRSDLALYAFPFKSALFPLGNLGVQIFFFISGFVISRGLASELAGAGTISKSAFFLRRAFRILPPLFLYAAVLALLTWAGLFQVRAVDFTRALLFACNLHACHDMLAHTWSLSFEEQFYIVFPTLFGLLAPARLGVVTLLMLLEVAILVVPLDGLAWYLTNFNMLFLGAVAFRHGDLLRGWILPMPRWSVPLAFILLLAVVVANMHLAARFGAYPPRIVDLALKQPLILFVVLGSLFHGGFFAKALAVPAVTAVGRASYGLYLWQQVATAAYGGQGALFYVLALALLLVVGLIQFRWMERPIIGLASWLSRSIQARGRRLAPEMDIPS